jgi:two-component sensor histidine kinase
MFVSAAWIFPAVLGGLNEIAQSTIWGDGRIDAAMILFTSLDWLFYGVLTPFVFAIAHRWTIVRPLAAWRVFLQGVFSLMFCVVWSSAGSLLRVGLEGVPKDGWVRPYVSWMFVTFPFGVAVYFGMVAIEHAIRYFTEARDHEIQMSRLSEQLSSARFAALQAQLNPHFMFNTLNTNAVLVREGDRAGASRIVEQLSDVLRRTLGRRSSETSLGEELELIRQYLAIEQARFPDRLHVEIDIDRALGSAAVPSFAVQHLVENAVRHGMAKSTRPGHVRVSARRDGNTLTVIVADDGPGFDVATTPPEGHGLSNTRERLRALYGSAGTLMLERGSSGGIVATLRVPYHEIEFDVADGR